MSLKESLNKDFYYNISQLGGRLFIMTFAYCYFNIHKIIDIYYVPDTKRWPSTLKQDDANGRTCKFQVNNKENNK